MRLVELIHFPGTNDHRARLMVNPDHVQFLVEAQSGQRGAQTWLRLQGHEQDFLIVGDIDQIAHKLASGYDAEQLYAERMR